MSAQDGVASADWPFIGLRPFESADSPYFFGRERSIAAVGKLVRASGFVSIVGSSGSGKSSLVSAGLVPFLCARADETWRIETLRPGKAPIEALTKAIGRLRGADDLARAWEEQILSSLRSSQFGIAEAISLFPASRRSDKFLLIVDQFEELFRFAKLHNSAELRTADGARNRDDATLFVRLLLAASEIASIDVHIVITMRSDFIGDCSQFYGLPEAVTRRQYLTPGLTRDERAAAISEPIALAGATIDPQLVQIVLNEASDELDQLPVLQHVMMRCWQRAFVRAKGGKVEITKADYDDVGGVAHALSKHANLVLDDIAKKYRPRGGRLVKRLFQALTEIDFNGRATRRPVKLDDLAGYVASQGDDVAATQADLRAIVQRLVAPDCSFLRVQSGELRGDAIVDIGHEALIRRWDKLKGVGDRDWVREEQEAGELYGDLVRRAKGEGTLSAVELPRYEQWWEKRRPSEIWARRFEREKGGRTHLKEAEDVIIRSRREVANKEQEKLRGEQAEMERLKAAAEQDRLKAEAEQERLRGEAEQERLRAEAEQARLKAEAAYAKAEQAVQRARSEKVEALASKQRTTSIAMGVVALFAVAIVALIAWLQKLENHAQRLTQEQITIEASKRILSADQLVGAADAVNLLVNAPVGAWSASYAATLRKALQELREVRRIHALRDPAEAASGSTGAVANVVFNPALPLLLATSQSPLGVHVIHYEDQGRKVSWLGKLQLPELGAGWITLRWSQDGSRLYLGTGNHGEIRTPCSISSFREHFAADCGGVKTDKSLPLEGQVALGSAAWSADGKFVAVTGFQGPPQLWNAETGALVSQPNPDAQQIPLTSQAFSASGLAAQGVASGAIRLLDANNGDVLQSYANSHFQSGPQNLAFNPADDHELLAVYVAGAALLTLKPKVPTFDFVWLKSGEAATVMQTAFSSNGAYALTAANDGAIRMYKLDPSSDPSKGLPPIELRGHRRAVFTLDVAPDGTVASGSADGTLRFWTLDSAWRRAQLGPADRPANHRLFRIARENLPFLDFTEKRIELPFEVTCPWARNCKGLSD